jgi:hypothetical protein
VKYNDIIEAAKDILENGRCPSCGKKCSEPNYEEDLEDDYGNDLTVYCQDDFHWQCDDLDVLVNATSEEEL